MIFLLIGVIGTIDYITTAKANHIYAETGKYTVRINGSCPSFNNAGKNCWKELTDIKSWGLLGYYDLNYGFANATSLSGIPNGIFAPNTIYASHCFSGCKELNVPRNFQFEEGNLKDISYFFYGIEKPYRRKFNIFFT